MNILVWIIVVGVIGWLGFVSFILFKAVANYNRLTQGVDGQTLSEILSKLLDQGSQSRELMKKLDMEMLRLERQSRESIKKIGLVRFNPFSDTGGYQSVAIALLDENNNGIVMTSLYARTGVRWYVKTVKKGKGIEHDLSNEEQEAVKKANK